MFNFLRNKKEYKYKHGDVVKAIIDYHCGCDFMQVETLVILKSHPYAKELQYFAHKENDNEVIKISEHNILGLLSNATNSPIDSHKDGTQANGQWLHDNIQTDVKSCGKAMIDNDQRLKKTRYKVVQLDIVDNEISDIIQDSLRQHNFEIAVEPIFEVDSQFPSCERIIVFRI